MTAEDAIRAFEDALRNRGIIPPPGGIRTDGKIQRCAVEGTPHKKDGSIIFFNDPPISGGFQNWRDGKGWENWTSGNGSGNGLKLTAEEVREAKARQAKINQAREQERADRQKKTAAEAWKIWEAAKPADPSHPYLTKKKIGPNILRVDGKGNLLDPMMDESGTLVNIQRIDANGGKKFLPGGKVAGTFSTFGPAPAPSGTIVIVEGVSTGISVSEATGLPTVAAMSADNLLAVGKIFRARYPKAKMIIFADNDTKETHGHARGVEAAEAAAKATGAYIAISLTSGDDANDLYAREGAAAVRAAIEAARTVGTETAPAIPSPEAEVPLSPRNSADNFQLERLLNRSATNYHTLMKKVCLTEDDNIDATHAAVPYKKPEINVGNQNLPALTKATWNAVAKANKPEKLFLLGDTAVRIEPNEEGFSVLKSLHLYRLRGEAARAADFVAFKKKNGKMVKVSALPPLPVIHDMLALPQAKIPLPPLSGVIHAPAFGTAGTLHVAPGYNPITRTYYAPTKGFRVLHVSESPTEPEIDLAKTLILDELLCDFPFTDEADLAHSVALLLLLFARSLIEGPTPLHLIDKPTQGTGATLLADVLTFPALGRSIAAMTEGNDEDEWRRRITAILLGGTTAVLFDNLRRPLDSGAVASVITATSWEDRRIGTSNNVHLPIQCTWIATANNAALSGEISRRTVLIRLDAKEVQPWLRSDFRHSDLRGWARENRAKLVWAALTLIQAWLAAGRPIPRDLPSFGMFEKWASVLGGVLYHVGIPGFLSNRSTLYNSSDSEGAEIRTFLNAWWAKHKDSDVGVAALWKIASSPESSLPIGDKGERSQHTRLGILLHKLRDQRYQLTEGCTVCVKSAGTTNNAAQWKLTCPAITL